MPRRLFLAAIAALAALTLPPAARAQQVVAEYYTLIMGEDLTNSKGARLSGLGQYLQQDRANYHRFGIRHEGDQGDPIFGARETRAEIPRLYANGGGAPDLEAQIRRYGSAYVLVRVFSTGGRLSHLLVFQGAG